MLKRTAILGLSLLVVTFATPATLADGKQKAQVCAACHGPDGNSINPIWPNLAGQNADYLAEQIRAFKTGARENPNMMPMVSGLEESDIVEIANYYAAQPAKIGAIDEATAAAGGTLYRGGDAERGIPACMACHGPTGAGNAAAKYPALRGQQAEYTVIQLKAYADGTRTTDPSGMMQTIAAKLSEEEMQLLAAFVSALH